MHSAMGATIVSVCLVLATGSRTITNLASDLKTVIQTDAPNVNAETSEIAEYFEKKCRFSKGQAKGAALVVQTLDPDAIMRDFFDNEFCGGQIEQQIAKDLEPYVKQWLIDGKNHFEALGKKWDEKTAYKVNTRASFAYAVWAGEARKNGKIQRVRNVYGKKCSKKDNFFSDCAKSRRCSNGLKCTKIGSSSFRCVYD